MKKLIVLLLLFFSVSAFCQPVLKFKAYQVWIDGDKISTGWLQYNSLVTIAKDEIKVYDCDPEQEFTVVNWGEIKYSTDGDQRTRLKCVDEHGKDCYVTIVVFKNPKSEHVASMLVNYSSGSFTYRLKKN